MTEQYLNSEQILGLAHNTLEFQSSSQEDVIHFEATTVPNSDIDNLFSGLGKKPSLEIMADKGEVKDDLPKSVDLRPFCSPVDNQGPDGLCTAYAKIGALELILRKRYNIQKNYSEDYLFSRYKQYSAVAAANAVCRYYMIDEKVWPFQAKQGKPGWEETKHCCLKDWREIKTLQEAKERLAEGEPLTLAVGLDVAHWRKPFIPHDKGTQKGGHDVCVVGYVDDNRFARGGYLIIKNSWGTRAGDKGYFYMPYAYITDSIFRAAFIGFSREVKFKNPPIEPVTTNLAVTLTPTRKYTPEGSKEHTTYAIVLTGPDAQNIDTAHLQLDQTLPQTLSATTINVLGEFSTWARPGWTAGTVTIKTKDGQKTDHKIIIPEKR